MDVLELDSLVGLGKVVQALMFWLVLGRCVVQIS